MSEGLSSEEVHQAVDRAVRRLLDEAGVSRPPVDAIAIAQGHLKMEVCIDRGQPQRGRAQRAGGRKQIFLRPEPREVRHQWTVAHEIGEHLKVQLLADLGIEPGRTRAMTGESLANLFANRLLVPTDWLADEARNCGFDLAVLEEHFSTASHEVIAWRLLDLPEPCIITILDNNTIYRRRSNAWRIRKQLAPAEQTCQQQVHRTSRPAHVRERGWTVQGWPIHQVDWKREILRSVVDEEAAFSEAEGGRAAGEEDEAGI
jgi:Zn-dependent peptidase ImmA (M78 family)